MNRILIHLGIFLFILGCNRNQGVDLLDIRKTAGDTILLWSQLTEDIRLVRLETKEGAFLDAYFRVWAGDKYIIVYGLDEMHQFTSEGKHIRKLASYGRAPGEFQTILALTVDEVRERLYYSDYGKQGYLQVIDLQNGQHLPALALAQGTPQKIILTEDSVFYCVSLSHEKEQYELFRVSLGGHLLGGIERSKGKEVFFKHYAYLGKSGKEVRYMYGITDTLYRVTTDGRVPQYCFRTGPTLHEYYSGAKGERMELQLETSRYLLWERMFVKVVNGGSASWVITYDENRDSKNCIYDKITGSIYKVKRVYFDELDIYSEDLLFSVSEHYLCHAFSATEFREMTRTEDSPYHYWHNEMTDEDNPVLILGRIKNKKDKTD